MYTKAHLYCNVHKLQQRKYFEFSWNLMEFGDTSSRTFLCAHGLLLCRQGLTYIKSPKNEILMSMLTVEGASGPGLNIIVPFLGISYITIGMLNIMSGLLFGLKEASLVLGLSGLVFHIGMAAVRATLDHKTSLMYKPGVISKTNRTQAFIGLFCLVVAFAVY